MLSGLAYVMEVVLIVGGAIVTGLVGHAVARRIYRRHEHATTHDIAKILLGSIGALLGLLLSIGFLAARIEYHDLRQSNVLEAAQLFDLHQDLRRYGGEEASRLDGLLVDYVTAVIEVEWPELAARRLPTRSATLFAELEDGLLRLQPDSPYRVNLHERMIVDIDEVSDVRQGRVFATEATSAGWFFTIVAIALLGTVVMLGVLPTGPLSRWLILVYALIVGVIVYSMHDFGSPFSGATRVSAEPFALVRAEMTEIDLVRD